MFAVNLNICSRNRKTENILGATDLVLQELFLTELYCYLSAKDIRRPKLATNKIGNKQKYGLYEVANPYFMESWENYSNKPLRVDVGNEKKVGQ